MSATGKSSPERPVRALFGRALRGFRREDPVLILGHNDADGLSATAILARAFGSAGWTARTRILGRGETAWSPEIAAEVAATRPGGLIVADLGTRPGPVAPGTPTVIIDHHVPTGIPEDATVVSGFPYRPIPTTSLLSFWCASELADVRPLLWLAAIGLIGDVADEAGFTALRKATALINAPRRSASGDARPALELLMKADGPKAVLSGEHAETAELLAAREEVKAALERGKASGPKVRDGVALIRFDTTCQVHPLLAQTWRGRLRNEIVLAANAGYRPGWIHFAARSARDVNLVEFLARHAPPGADENYGGGHAAASGGALRPAAWNYFVAGLGFGPETQVTA